MKIFAFFNGRLTGPRDKIKFYETFKNYSKPKKRINVKKDAIAYTDTIHGYNEDSIWYYNSNGHKVTILAPYVVYEISKNSEK